MKNSKLIKTFNLTDNCILDMPLVNKYWKPNFYISTWINDS